MKTSGFLLCLLIVQAYASFFDNFQGVMTSVTNNFGTLLGDVITDVRKTIDCSILAVEQLLSISEMFEESSEYKKFCKGEVDQSLPPPPDISNVDNTLSELTKELKISDDIAKDEEVIKKEFKVDFDSVYSGVNETLCGIRDDGDPYARLENAKTILKNETDRLAEVSALLRRELDKISKDMRDKFEELKLNEKDVSFESIWHDMKILHEVEQNNKNSDDAKIISGILDEALEILNLNDKNSTNSTDDDKIIKIVKDLREPSNRTGLYDDVIKEISQWQNETTSSNYFNATDVDDVVKEIAQLQNETASMRNFIKTTDDNVLNEIFPSQNKTAYSSYFNSTAVDDVIKEISQGQNETASLSNFNKTTDDNVLNEIFQSQNKTASSCYFNSTAVDDVIKKITQGQNETASLSNFNKTIDDNVLNEMLQWQNKTASSSDFNNMAIDDVIKDISQLRNETVSLTDIDATTIDDVIKEKSPWQNETALTSSFNETTDRLAINLSDVLSEPQHKTALINPDLIPKYVTGAMDKNPLLENAGSLKKTNSTNFETIEIIKTVEPTVGNQTILDYLNEMEIPDYLRDFFGFTATNVDDEIKSIIQNSNKTSLMTSLLNDSTLDSKDVFENPELLDLFS